MENDKLDPDCMSCSKTLSLDFVADVTPKNFHEYQYRNKRAADLLSQEKSLLPDTQHLVEQQKNKLVYESEIRELLDEEEYLIFRMNEIHARVRELRFLQKLQPREDAIKERKKFTVACPVNKCRGFLSQAWKCGTCDVYVCSKCREPKKGRDDDTHVCDPGTIETIKLMKDETKPCPKCSIPIYKISGCDQMWCQHEDTIVWMWNGEKKMAVDVETGDLLIGDDGTPRKVEEITHGHADMYEVHQRFGENYKVIGKHLLTLKNNDNIVDISVEDYLQLDARKRERGYHRVACNIIHWEKQSVPLDPYILGMWLGDGTSDGFASNDPILIREWVNWSAQNDCNVVHTSQFGYHIRNAGQGNVLAVGYNSIKTCNGCKTGVPSLTCASKEELEEMIRGEPNNMVLIDILNWRLSLPTCELSHCYGKSRSVDIFKSKLQECGVLNNKHIPLSYIANDAETRFQLLAGLIDTDGNVLGKAFRFSQSIDRKILCDGVIDVAHSLGFATTVKTHSPGSVTFPHGKTYLCKNQIKIRIVGNTSTVPTRLKRINKVYNYPSSTIKITPAGCGRFVGWRLSGETHRYLLGDGTVTHNCTNCHTVFSWNKGKTVNEIVHNPHFYEWQRQQNNGRAPRVHGDRPGCEELPWVETVTHVLNQRGQNFPAMSDCHRLVVHIQEVVIPRYPIRAGIMDNSDLRVKYLMKEIDESKWTRILKARQKKTEKDRAVHQVLEMFTTSMIDLFNTYVTGQTNNLEKQTNALREYVNHELAKIGNQYNNKVPRIGSKWVCP